MDKKENGGRGKTAGQMGVWGRLVLILKKGRIPWGWVAVTFIVTTVYNELLFKLPTTTASLMAGELSGKALMGSIWYFVLFALVICSQSALLAITKCLASRNARNVLWDRMLKIRMDYYDKNDPADQMSAVTNDLSSAMPDLVALMVTLLPDIYFVIRAMVQVYQYHSLLMLAVLIFFPVKWVYMVFFGRRYLQSQERLFDRIGNLTGYLAERIVNLPLIKSYTREDFERDNGKNASDQLYRAQMRIRKIGAIDSAVNTMILLLQQIIIMVFAVILLQKGEITMAQWVAFFLFFEDISLKIDTFINDWIFAKNIQGSLRRTVDMLMVPTEAQEDHGTEGFVNGDIVFDHVTFSYGDKPALKDVSFRVPKGTSAAVVGLCGSGKTTSLNLLERFYQVSGGQVCLGERPIGSMALGTYREHFAYVQQNPEVFGGTLKEALTYGITRELSDEEILKAAEITGFSDYIKKHPEGLLTPVAPGGGSMSGGQLQRLVLTREFLRGSEVLLLDEPTSALDAETAENIKDQILTLFSDKTILIVTHDLKLLQGLDQIIVLKDGEMKGCGTYEQLMDSCELFVQMVATMEEEMAMEEETAMEEKMAVEKESAMGKEAVS